MRILHLDIQEFGALHGRRFSTDAAVVVVYGRNERGKSSFHQALRSVLFGFGSPSSRLHPYADPAFCGGESGGEAVLEIAATVRTTGGTFQIERRMDTSPSSRLTLEEASAKDSGFVRSNEPVPAVGGVTGSLFDAVYTLDPDRARAFDRELEGEVEVLLQGGGGLPDLASVPELSAEIDAQRSRLWRNDRRSKKTTVARLDERLAELQAEGREARRVEEELIRLESELENGRQQLAVDAAELILAQERVSTLRLIERAARISHAALDHDVDLSPFDAMTLTPPAPMLADLEDGELALEAPTRRLAEPRPPFEAADDLLLEQRDAIAGLGRQETRVQQWLTKAASQRFRAREARSTADYLECSVPHRRGGERVEGRRAWPQPLGWGAATIAGGAAGGAALASGAHWTGALAAAVAPAAALVAVGAVPVETRQVLAPGSPAAALRGEAEALEDEAWELAARSERERQRWGHMAADLAPDVPQASWTSLDDAPDLLRDRLARAASRERASRADAEERRRAETERERAAQRLREVSDRFEVMRSALVSAAPDEPVLERAYQRVADAWAARERSRGALRELREEANWSLAAADPLMDDALGHGAFDGARLRTTEDRVTELEEHMAKRRDELARMDERLMRERPKRTRSAIDSEALQLRSERAEAMKRHGELTRLRDAILEGEQRYRTEHQPAILESAGRWLASITEGRYRSLAFDGVSRNGERSGLTVLSREAGGFVPCEPPLSRGVREQVHLALRLGVAEAADAASDPLPLLLDEALVHWDEQRRAGLYRALRARASVTGPRGRHRQIFLFTCHEPLAKEAEDTLEALRIDL